MSMVIFDIDGVVADTAHRQHLVPEKGGNWKSFHAACVDDPPIPEMVELVRAMARQKMLIVFTTGRPEYVRHDTEAWLKYNVTKYFVRLYMRGARNHQPGALVKRRMITQYNLKKQDVLFVVEDNPSCVAMWREQGFTCLDIGTKYSGDTR